ARSSVLINCTVGSSVGDGIVCAASKAHLTAANIVVWGSVGESIVIRNAPNPVVSFSNIQGGWPGAGNIDADPMFVQPGTDDLRLSDGSPCVDAGDSAALPPDELDLDGDGDTTEPVPLDLGGTARVQGAAVDMGAYEGQFAPGAPAAGEGDLDQGEFAVLVPEGGQLDPLSSPAVLLTNISGGDNATATVTQIDFGIHAGAGGYSELGSVLVLETSLGDGQYLATVMIPFDSAMIGGAAPRQVRATWCDAGAGAWALGVWGNAGNRPGHAGPIGDRSYSEAPAGWGLTQQVGDHGVYWDPVSGRGFAWAQVDHASEFGVGVSSCPSDCLQAPDDQVSIADMLALLGDWG
ncbi:MAG: choice-of-anchor Q domain-containing protein, partial [Gemmatimonadales bacterium]